MGLGQPPTIRAAAISEADILSALAMQAKAHWGYSAETLEGWRDDLAISPDTIRGRPTFVAIVDNDIVGFYSLRVSHPSWEMDNLWVRPEFMRRGIGRALLSHALELASRGGATQVTVDSDPNAEAFYLACGAIRRGNFPAPVAGQPGRLRPQLVFERLSVRA